MKYFIKFVSIIGLLSFSQLAYSDSITDNYTTGDTLTAATLNNIKAAVNDNDTNVGTNATAISGNTAGIGANATAIGTNTSAIGTKQNIVTGTCPAGQSIRVINANGSVTCEVDTDTNTNASTLCTAGQYLSGSGACVEKRPYRIGGSILAAASVDITDMAGELGLSFRMTMGNSNTPNAYVHITCSGQESNNISGCFAWGPGSVGPISFNIFTTQTATSLTTTRGQIQTISQIGVFRITNNTGGTISFNVLIEPSFTNPN